MFQLPAAKEQIDKLLRLEKALLAIDEENTGLVKSSVLIGLLEALELTLQDDFQIKNGFVNYQEYIESVFAKDDQKMSRTELT